MKLKTVIYFTLSFLILGTAFSHVPFCRASKQDSQHCPFCVLASMTWWSHDAVGYHPAMFILLDNISDHDIIGEEIPFQARFTDLRDGFITVAREYKHPPIHNHERFVVLLRAPRSFELPIDSSLWPSMECKAMCRMPHGQGSDPQVDNLVVTHLNRVTMTDEDAHSQLIAQAEHNPLLTQVEMPAYKESTTNEASTKLIDVPQSTNHMKLPKHLPQIGDDFYVFEQLFGKASEFQPSANNSSVDLTWAHYRATAPLFDIYAGSRNASKVDVLVVTVLNTAIPKELDALSLAKVLAGCRKEEHIAPFVHSVRYLSGGRSEIMTTGIRDRKILAFPVDDPSSNSSAEKTVIVITRLAGDPETALDLYRKRVNFLQI